MYKKAPELSFFQIFSGSLEQARQFITQYLNGDITFEIPQLKEIISSPSIKTRWESIELLLKEAIDTLDSNYLLYSWIWDEMHADYRYTLDRKRLEALCVDIVYRIYIDLRYRTAKSLSARQFFNLLSVKENTASKRLSRQFSSNRYDCLFHLLGYEKKGKGLKHKIKAFLCNFQYGVINNPPYNMFEKIEIKTNKDQNKIQRKIQQSLYKDYNGSPFDVLKVSQDATKFQKYNDYLLTIEKEINRLDEVKEKKDRAMSFYLFEEFFSNNFIFDTVETLYDNTEKVQFQAAEDSFPHNNNYNLSEDINDNADSFCKAVIKQSLCHHVFFRKHIKRVLDENQSIGAWIHEGSAMKHPAKTTDDILHDLFLVEVLMYVLLHEAVNYDDSKLLDLLGPLISSEKATALLATIKKPSDYKYHGHTFKRYCIHYLCIRRRFSQLPMELSTEDYIKHIPYYLSPEFHKEFFRQNADMFFQNFYDDHNY